MDEWDEKAFIGEYYGRFNSVGCILYAAVFYPSFYLAACCFYLAGGRGDTNDVDIWDGVYIGLVEFVARGEFFNVTRNETARSVVGHPECR